MFRLTTSVPHMTTAQSISDRLAAVVVQAIRSAGLSQRAVAEKSGIPLVTLNRRLTGKAAFTVLEVAAVAEVVGVGVTELFLRAERAAELVA